MLHNPGSVQLILFFSGIGSLFFLLLLQLETLKILIPFGIITFLYVGKFPVKKIINLRDIPFLKAHLVAGVWTGVSIILPALQSDLVWTWMHWIFFLAIYCFVLSLAIIFDIRDIQLDEPEKRTIPQLLGKKGAVAVAIFFNLAALGILIFLDQIFIVPLLFFSIISITSFIIALRRNDDFYFSFWVDGLILIFSAVIIVTTLF